MPRDTRLWLSSHQLYDLSDSARPMLQDGDWSERSLASIERRLDRLRAIDPPTSDWALLRDQFVDQGDAILGLARRGADASDWEPQAAKARAADLQTRFAELAARS